MAGPLSEMPGEIIRAFRDRFGQGPSLVARAPGRVNLIGEHTDYNDGFVLPMAIDRAAWIALSPWDKPMIEVESLLFHKSIRFSTEDFSSKQKGWGAYIQGAAWAAREHGLTLRGFRAVFTGDVPLGSGLSSSAALEVAVVKAIDRLAGGETPDGDLARIAQRAENEWAGVQCGIMDQLISAAGEKGHALLIDCRSLQASPAPLPDGYTVVIMDTATPRSLAGSAYNQRRRECEGAAKLLGVETLRDVDEAALEKKKSSLPNPLLRRARHVVTENARTLRAAEAMNRSDAERLGALMNESHDSLRDDYEVSCPELDVMVEIARKTEGCHGGRMTGAGFGGCAVALLEKEKTADFISAVSRLYRDQTGKKPSLFASEASQGAEAWEVR